MSLLKTFFLPFLNPSGLTSNHVHNFIFYVYSLGLSTFCRGGVLWVTFQVKKRGNEKSATVTHRHFYGIISTMKSLSQSPLTAPALTRAIIEDLFRRRVFAWRSSSTGVPGPGGALRAASKKGVADVIGVTDKGLFLAIEVKIGKDRLSPEQTGFLKTINSQGGIGFTASTFEEYLQKSNSMI